MKKSQRLLKCLYVVSMNLVILIPRKNGKMRTKMAQKKNKNDHNFSILYQYSDTETICYN